MLIGPRLRQLRLARGYSLEELAGEMGGIVTRQALSKYENSKAQPTSTVLNKLASALGVKARDLSEELAFSVEFHGFRKRSRLGKREQERIKSKVTQLLEHRVRLQNLYDRSGKISLPLSEFSVSTLEDAEEAAYKLRKKWKLGDAPISSITDTLEDFRIHVLEFQESDLFDGLSATALDAKARPLAAAVITRAETAGERQRFNLAHELAHLVTHTESRLDQKKQENMANRFAGAFLVPGDVLRINVGEKRHHITLSELLLLKQKFGISIQALLYRMKDLEIIANTVYRNWCIEINAHGWKRDEPGRLDREEPKWFRRTLLHAVTEDWIGKQEAERMLGEPLEREEPLSLRERRAFMKLPLEERRRVMAQQAKELSEHYDKDREWRELESGDLIEY